MILNERTQKYAYIQWSIQSDGKRRDLEQCSSSDQLSNAKRFPCMLVANVVNVVNIKSTCSAWGFNIYSWLYCFAQEKKLFFYVFMFASHSYLISYTTCLVFVAQLQWNFKMCFATNEWWNSILLMNAVLFHCFHLHMIRRKPHKSHRFISNSTFNSQFRQRHEIQIFNNF